MELIMSNGARRDESPLVGVAAIRALAGWLPSKSSKLQATGDAPLEDVSDLRMRSRAWQVTPSQFLSAFAHGCRVCRM